VVAQESKDSDWLSLAEKMDEISNGLAFYLALDPVWLPTSPARSALFRESDYQSLPSDRPVRDILTRPLQLLRQAEDHFRAMAAVIRTPETALALFTLARTVYISSAAAHYLSDPSDLHERVRRGLNFELHSATEAMNLTQGQGDSFAFHDRQRRAITKAARQLGFKTVTPEKKQTATTWPAWYLDRPWPKDMQLIRGIVDDMTPGVVIGDTVFRLLSGFAHAQPHVLTFMVEPGVVQHRDDGTLRAGLSLDGRTILTWLSGCVTAMTVAWDACRELYGWPPLRWRSTAMAYGSEWTAMLRSTVE
jgi:hypothetical protein